MRGARHRAVIATWVGIPESVGFVVSQDGHVRTVVGRARDRRLRPVRGATKCDRGRLTSRAKLRLGLVFDSPRQQDCCANYSSDDRCDKDRDLGGSEICGIGKSLRCNEQ